MSKVHAPPQYNYGKTMSKEVNWQALNLFNQHNYAQKEQQKKLRSLQTRINKVHDSEREVAHIETILTANLEAKTVPHTPQRFRSLTKTS